jgi:low affinity Fe/Cu permease
MKMSSVSDFITGAVSKVMAIVVFLIFALILLVMWAISGLGELLYRLIGK